MEMEELDIEKQLPLVDWETKQGHCTKYTVLNSVTY